MIATGNQVTLLARAEVISKFQIRSVNRLVICFLISLNAVSTGSDPF
jgi:hypothetical protein